MPCYSIKTTDGSTGIICTRGPSRKYRKCKYCGKPAPFLCDFPMSAIGVEMADGRKTCDAAICGEHSVHVAQDTDYCAAHHQMTVIKGERPVFGEKENTKKLETMKAITLWQPWATLWALQIKRNETRSWAARFRGPLAIHAAKNVGTSYHSAAEIIRLTKQEPFKTTLAEAGYPMFAALPRGCIIAVCDYVTSFPVEVALADMPKEKHFLETAFGDYSRGRYAWSPINMRMLKEPIPARGAQGLWDWTPPGELEFK